jgi:hypothetical protein
MPEETVMFVVNVVNDGVRQPPKVFSTLIDAHAFAAQQVQAGNDAKVYKVAVTNDVRAAIAACEMGEAELVAAPQRKPSEHEIEVARKREAWRDLQELIGHD